MSEEIETESEENEVDLKKLEERMTRLRDLKDLYQPVVDEMEQLEAIITATLLTINEADAPIIPRLQALYKQGRGSYDYEAIAQALKVPQVAIDKHTTPKVAWRSACMEVGIPLDVQQEHYQPGTMKVELEHTAP